MNFSYLSPPERIEIIRALVTFLSKKDSLEIDLYFSEFGIENLNNDWIPLMEGTQKSLQSANDEILLNLYKFLIDGVNVSLSILGRMAEFASLCHIQPYIKDLYRLWLRN